MPSTDLRNLAETLTTDGVLIHRGSGTGLHSLIIEANIEACRLLGCPRTELLTLTMADVTASSPIAPSALEQLRTTGTAHFEHRFKTVDGRTVPLEITMRATVIDETPMTVTILRDATRRKEMERDLDTARHDARVAGEFKSQFLANMSHELRTPLNGIMGMTQILMNAATSPDQKEYLRLSLEAARQLNKALTDLLALSSIQSGGIGLSATDFDLHATLSAVTKPLALQAADKSLRLKLHIAPNVPAMVNGDAGKIRQILINLLLNAIKFTEDGEISLSVQAAPHRNEKGTVDISFTVTDSGIGIPPELHESVFESFSLVEDYMTKQYGGTGLGLTISRQLAHIMGGEINLDSLPGKGSAFVLSVPLRIKKKAVSRPQSISPPEPVGQLKILLAEDEQVNSIMASRLLKNAGHTVTVAGNGQQALDLLSNNTYDLVLMDVQMPVLNGLQATEIIRSGAAENIPPDLPVIGLTAYARRQERQQFTEAGMQHIVTKPYEAEDLLQAISRAMTD